MASTPLAESSRNPLPSVEDSATELVRRASSSHFIIPNRTLPPQVLTSQVAYQKVVKLILFSRTTVLEFAASKHPEVTEE